MDNPKKSRPSLDTWKSMTESEQARYRPAARRHTNPSLGGSRTRSSLNSLYGEELGYYICDEPETATQLAPFIGTLDSIDCGRYVPANTVQFLLFVGDLAAANDQSLLRKNNIKAVLSLGENNGPARYPSVTGGYQLLPVRDDPDEELFRYFDEIFRFLSAKLPQGNVLVHCYRGRNRSCAAVIYYLMRQFRLSFVVSREIVLQSRGGFMKLSRPFENQLRQAERIMNKHR